MSNIGGYHLNTVKPVPKHLICPICTHILKDTIQTSRGERACKDCYSNASKQLGKGICPIDGEGGTITFKDKYADKEISESEVYCKNKVNGCDWVGLLKALFAQHLQECQFARGSSKQASTIQCPWKCGQHVNGLALDKHINNCARATAPNCCILEALGCPYNGSVPLDAHTNASSIEHAKLLIPRIIMNSVAYKTLETELTMQKELTQEMENKLEAEMNKSIAAKVEIKGVVEELFNAFNEKNDQVEAEMKEMREKIEKLTNQVQNQKTTELQEKVKKLEKAVDKKEDAQRLSAAGAATNTATTKAVEEVNKKVVTCENNYNSLRSNISELDLRQQLLENTCFGGRFLWKIDKLKHRMKQAVLGQVTALHSAPCFTKRFGYKFCARLYLNGDGMGKNTHISLFFVMMRSEYDALLIWPFKEKVSFKLINHVNENDSIKESFTPDAHSASFKRPTREMNVAAGCPMFVAKEKLENGNFIFDDSIFIETIVGNN